MKTKLTYHLLDSTMKEYQRLTEFCPGTHQWIIRAKEQKAGRGRGDRFWYSPEGGLWLTFDIYYDDFIPNFPLFIAYCIHSLLLELFPLESLSIKWPNDIMWKNKKMAGILCEHNEVEKKYIIGLGLNTNLNQEIIQDKHIVTISDAEKENDLCIPVYDDANQGKLKIAILSSLIGFPISNEYLLELIIANVYKKLDLLSKPKIYLDYINLWLYGLNQIVHAQLDNKIVIGKNIGVADDGTLLLKDKDAHIQKINYGSFRYIPDL